MLLKALEPCDPLDAEGAAWSQRLATAIRLSPQAARTLHLARVPDISQPPVAVGRGPDGKVVGLALGLPQPTGGLLPQTLKWQSVTHETRWPPRGSLGWLLVHWRDDDGHPPIPRLALDAQWLLDAQPAAQARSLWPRGATVELAVVLGRLTLPDGSLDVGHIWIPELFGPGVADGTLRGETLIVDSWTRAARYRAQLDDGRLQIWKKLRMQSKHKPGSPETSTTGLTLQVELGRVQRTLAELERLEPGMVIEDVVFDDTLWLSAGPHRVARCALVQVDQRPALKVLALEDAG